MSRQPERKSNGLVFWFAAILMAALIAIIGFLAFGAGMESSDLGLTLLGLSLVALSVPYFYRYYRGFGLVPRFALVLGVLGVFCFLGAAYVFRHAASLP